jgi:hypothetical protein
VQTPSEFHILNLGAGVQSTTLYLMSMRGEVRRFDYAIFADTGEEPAAVYRHLEWLKSLDGPTILVRSKGRLGDDLARGVNSTGQRFASIPAFTLKPDGEEGRTRRQCSREYKIEVIEQTIRREILGLKPRQRIPRGAPKVYQYYGISFDERWRAASIWENYHIGRWVENKKTGKRRLVKSPFEPGFPLVDRAITRADCITYLHDKVPHKTPRSACVFCPFHDDAEWENVRQVPEDWERAVYIDHQLRVPGNIVNRNLDQQLFVHRSCKPIDQVEFNPRPNVKEMQYGLGFGYECEGVCGV